MLSMIQRIADLSPPLGKPGGPCQVVDRIEDKIPNLQLQQNLINDVQEGQDLSNQEASKIYRLEREPGVGAVSSIEITSHGQYRMDLRHITVDHVRGALASFLQNMDRLKAVNTKGHENMSKALDQGEEISWVDPRSKLKLVFKHTGSGKVVLITTYWKGRQDLNKPEPGVCTTTYDRRK
jgi:predicted GIY-YIG superfamily endonuclease